MNFDIRDIFLNKIYKSNNCLKWYKLRNEPASIHELPAGKCYLNTFTAIVDLSRSNFSIARAPLFQLKSAT